VGGDAGIIGGIKIMRIIEGIIYGFSYPILACGVAIYILQHFFGKTEPPSFELAIISAIIGGFALSSGFLEKVSSGLQLTIRRIGTFYLGAAIAFVVFALVMPMAKLETEGITYWVVFLATSISMLAAIGFFAYATGFLIAKFPAIFREVCSKK
jgi:hypothetical protein